MLDPAFSSRADFGSKKSASRPTSCTGQPVRAVVGRAADRIRGVVAEERVLQIM